MCIRDSGNSNDSSDVFSAYNCIVVGNATAIRSVKLFQPLQPILGNSTEYTHSTKLMPYIDIPFVGSWRLYPATCMRNLVAAT